MTKFLKLCEQFDPSNQDVQDAALWIKQVLSEADIPFSSEGDEIRIPTDYGVAVLKVVAFEKDQDINFPQEDEESINAGTGTYEVDKEVEKLGSTASGGLRGLAARKLFGTAAQKAKTAVKKRQNIAKQAVDAYDQGTKRIEKGLQNIRRTSMKTTY
jgi:hypothetical protein